MRRMRGCPCKASGAGETAGRQHVQQQQRGGDSRPPRRARLRRSQTAARRRPGRRRAPGSAAQPGRCPCVTMFHAKGGKYALVEQDGRTLMQHSLCRKTMTVHMGEPQGEPQCRERAGNAPKKGAALTPAAPRPPRPSCPCRRRASSPSHACSHVASVEKVEGGDGLRRRRAAAGWGGSTQMRATGEAGLRGLGGTQLTCTQGAELQARCRTRGRCRRGDQTSSCGAGGRWRLWEAEEAQSAASDRHDRADSCSSSQSPRSSMGQQRVGGVPPGLASFALVALPRPCKVGAADRQGRGATAAVWRQRGLERWPLAG